MATDIFRRVEKKYILNKEQFLKIKKVLEGFVVPDEYGKSLICNIYFDTRNYDFISHSITKPFSKDKIRLRSYNVPKRDSTVFLEIKRKVDGVVGKRRINMSLSEYEVYSKNRLLVNNNDFRNMQIRKELDYYFDRFDLEPKMYISYEREAFYDKDNRDFRITFDSNILARDYDLDLQKGSYGDHILEENKYIMEIKSLGAIPLWFVKVINDCKICPCGFSKYGEAYTQISLKANTNKECVV